MSTLHLSTAADNPQAHTIPNTDLPSSAESSRLRVTELLVNTEHNTPRKSSAALPSPLSAENVDDKATQPTVAISHPQSDSNVQKNTVEAASVTTSAFNTKNVQDNPVDANLSPVKVEKPSSKAHKWSWNSRFRNRLLNWWLWELLSVAMSILCFVAMIILLAISDQKDVPRFRYGLTVCADLKQTKTTTDRTYSSTPSFRSSSRYRNRQCWLLLELPSDSANGPGLSETTRHSSTYKSSTMHLEALGDQSFYCPL